MNQCLKISIARGGCRFATPLYLGSTYVLTFDGDRSDEADRVIFVKPRSQDSADVDGIVVLAESAVVDDETTLPLNRNVLVEWFKSNMACDVESYVDAHCYVFNEQGDVIADSPVAIKYSPESFVIDTDDYPLAREVLLQATSAKDQAITARDSAISAKNSAISAKSDAEAASLQAESSKAVAEGASTAAQEAAATSSSASATAIAAQNAAENAQAAAEEAAKDAVAAMSSKADKATTYTKDEVDAAMANKANQLSLNAETTRALNAEYSLFTSLSSVNGKIPVQASAQNQLADKAFVNSSIATNTAFYISDNGAPFQSLADLETYEGALTNNDYAFVVGQDSAGNTTYTRYKWNEATETWGEEYVLNNSSFTAAQWAAISSGITSGLVAKLGALPTAAELSTAFASMADKVANATGGNFAGLDSNGNLTDSGKKASDFAAAMHSHTASQVTGLGSAAMKDVPASGDAGAVQVVLGSDSRLSDSRTPTSHASSHATGGADAIAPSDIGAATPAQIGIPAFSTTATYAVGARVVSNGVLYRCTTEVSTPGPWDASKWTVLFDFATDTEPTELSNALLTSDRIWLALSVKASVASTVLTPHYAGDWIVDITLTAEQKASLLESSQGVGEDASANDYAITVSGSSILYVGTYNAAAVVITEDGGKVTFSAGDPALGLSLGDQVAHKAVGYYVLGLQDTKLLQPLIADLATLRAGAAAGATAAQPGALRYDMGAPIEIDTASSEVVEGETVYYGAATLADRTGNIVQVTAAIDELRITFPAATSGKLRDFGLRVEVGTGSAALTAPALVPIGPTGETIKLENNAKQIPALADGTATAKGVTLLYFSETAPGVFVVKGEQVEEVA